MIYFLYFHKTKFLKIGWSENPAIRFYELGVRPGICDLLGMMDGGRDEEQALHRQFREWCTEDYSSGVAHEYYHDNQLLRDYIKDNAHMDYGRYGVKKPGKAHVWTLAYKQDREEQFALLRRLLHDRPGGKRLHGLLTDAQLIDWGLEALLKETRKTPPAR